MSPRGAPAPLLPHDEPRPAKSSQAGLAVGVPSARGGRISKLCTSSWQPAHSITTKLSILPTCLRLFLTGEARGLQLQIFNDLLQSEKLDQNHYLTGQVSVVQPLSLSGAEWRSLAYLAGQNPFCWVRRAWDRLLLFLFLFLAKMWKPDTSSCF